MLHALACTPLLTPRHGLAAHGHGHAARRRRKGSSFPPTGRRATRQRHQLTSVASQRPSQRQPGPSASAESSGASANTASKPLRGAARPGPGPAPPAAVRRPFSNGNAAEVPHSAIHYSACTTRRAFKGWYIKVTLPSDSTGSAAGRAGAADGKAGGRKAQSFAFIHALEDPAGGSELSKVSSQVGGAWGGGAA